MAYLEKNEYGIAVRLYVTSRELAEMKLRFPVMTEECYKSHTLYGAEIVVAEYATAPPPKAIAPVIPVMSEAAPAPNYSSDSWGRVRWRLYDGWLSLQLGALAVAGWFLPKILIILFKLNRYFLRKGAS